MSPLTPLQAPDAAAPRAHYSAAMRAGAMLFVSGQIAPGPDTDVAAQTRQCLAQIDALLRAAGSSRERIAKVTVVLADLRGMAEFETAYAAFFGAHKPARTLVPAAGLPPGMLVEIDAVAVLDT